MKYRELSGNLRKKSTIPNKSDNEEPLENNYDISNISQIEDAEDTCYKIRHIQLVLSIAPSHVLSHLVKPL